MTVVEQHLEAVAGQQVLAFDRLIGIGIGTQVDRRADIARLAQLLFEQGHGIGLGDQLGFKIQPRRQIPVSVAGPGVTINAAMFTATVGIERAVKRQVRRLVAGDDAFCGFAAHLGRPARRHLLKPAVIAGDNALRRKTVMRITGGTATARRQRNGHGLTP